MIGREIGFQYVSAKKTITFSTLWYSHASCKIPKIPFGLHNPSSISQKFFRLYNPKILLPELYTVCFILYYLDAAQDKTKSAAQEDGGGGGGVLG